MAVDVVAGPPPEWWWEPTRIVAGVLGGSDIGLAYVRKRGERERDWGGRGVAELSGLVCYHFFPLSRLGYNR